mmetsp:Transcript_19948/g.35080  ORF Transcript_19948/g.35080 Transcript_19948/m.35080 type:complete len:274 (-) Transcript_19948:103-924(-)
MAPNKKNIAVLELPAGTAGLQSTIQAKFLPLTDPSEAQQHHGQQQETTQSRRQEASASYWDWTSDTQAEEEAEKVADLFSMTHIVSNMIKDGQQYVSSPANQVAAHDDYWAENSNAAEEEAASTKGPQHESESFWYWPANQKVHEEEKAQRLTSTNNIESNLKNYVPPQERGSTKDTHDSYWTWDASSKATAKHEIPGHVLDPTHPNYDYWTWNTPSEEEKKKMLIQSILESEQARQLLSAEHIEEQLVQHASRPKDETNVAPAIAAGGYWDW